MSTFSFSKVVIIQSLEKNEDQTGTMLLQFMDKLRTHHADLPPAQVVDSASKEDFVAVISKLAGEARAKGEMPIVQIETHGWSDKSGLAFRDRSSLSWGEMAGSLSELNRATGFNLVVCLSACFGGHFIESLRPDHPSPCFAMIGPTHAMYPEELLKGFESFYEKLLTERDASSALTALHAHEIEEGGFLNTTAEDWFFKVADGYLKTHCTPDELRRRAGKIIEEVRTTAKALTPEQEKYIEALGEKMAFGFLDRQFPVFFMTETIPANYERFARSLVEAKGRAASFLKGSGSVL